MDNKDLGNKIRKYRKSKELTIKQLAECANVTPSLLSQIERGLANPSINTLKVISKVLQVPLFTFFMEPSKEKKFIVRPENRVKMTIPKSKNITFELLSPDLNGIIEFGILKLPPNAKNSETIMENKYELLCYILKGKVELFLDDEIFVLNSGDSVRVDPLTKYQFVNNFDEPMEMIFANSQLML